MTALREPFTVRVTGPRTEPVTLPTTGVPASTKAARTWPTPTSTPGRIGGAAFAMFWTEVTLERDEPSTHTTVTVPRRGRRRRDAHSPDPYSHLIDYRVK